MPRVKHGHAFLAMSLRGGMNVPWREQVAGIFVRYDDVREQSSVLLGTAFVP